MIEIIEVSFQHSILAHYIDLRKTAPFCFKRLFNKDILNTRDFLNSVNSINHFGLTASY